MMRRGSFAIRRRAVLAAMAFLAGGVSGAIALAGGKVTPPAQFFGFEPGADRKIARWDRIVAYFELLATQSSCIRVENLGPTTEGNPFLLVLISSTANLGRLERLREVNATLSDPRGLDEARANTLIAEGRAVVCQTMSLHASEIGGTQAAPVLAYELLTRQDEETKRILDNVVFLLVPSLNPDGQIMVTDWYRKTLGSEYEGVDLPWLYHKYAGHDNNRDSYQLNLVESRYLAKVMFRDWPPQAYLDHHHMGSYGARLYVPPYSEPLRPFADPLVWREHSWYGGHIAYKLEEAEKAGILNAAQYPGWGHFGWHWIAPFHNIAGMLTESASARLATPIFVHPEQLRANTRAFPEYEAQSNFPRPWPGGWWHLSDIVEQQKISAWALLDLAACHRETVLRNAYLKAKRQIERGATGKPVAYVIPAGQHDPLTAVELVNTLLLQGVEVARARRELLVAGMRYPAGSYVVALAQPKMGLVRNLLGRTRYPDNSWTRDASGAPLRPYDSATHTMAEFMGVRVEPIDELGSAELEVLRAPVAMSGRLGRGAKAVLRLDGRLNASYKADNRLLDAGIEVRRVDGGDGGAVRRGDFVVAGGSTERLARVAAETGVDFVPLASAPSTVHPVARQRVGVYQRYHGGNTDEGWTRLLLEQFGFPYTTVLDAPIKKGELSASFDVLILPSDSAARIKGEKPEGREEYPDEVYPPEYRSGIGKEGGEGIKKFVEAGGTLIALGESTNYAIEILELAVRNVTKKLDSKEFFCPGSTLRASFDEASPFGYGMPREGLVLFWSSPAFEIVPSDRNDRYQTVVRYAERDLLESGWLVGEKSIARRAGMVVATVGKGKVVLIGFRAQHRAQTHGTYKLLFNALLQ
jgi:hypothetical protein